MSKRENTHQSVRSLDHCHYALPPFLFASSTLLKLGDFGTILGGVSCGHIAGIAILVVIIIGVVIATRNKNKGDGKSDSGSQSGGNGGGAGGKFAASGGDGSMITMDDNTQFTYQNKFGGNWLFNAAQPFNGGKANSWTPAINETWAWGTNEVQG